MENNLKQKVYIVIPAYNEEKVIGKVIADIKKSGYENIIVVDDGSSDRTGKIALLSETEVIKQVINRGQGAALRAGIEYVKEKYDPDAVVTFDADGQHNPKDIQKMIQPILDGSADIVLGSRFLSAGEKVPFARKLVLKAGIIFTNIISDIKLTDTHNGLRALGKKAIRLIKINHRGMEHASDIIDEIRKKKLRYIEVPVNIIYSDYSLAKGQSSLNFLKLGFKILMKKLIK